MVESEKTQKKKPLCTTCNAKPRAVNNKSAIYCPRLDYTFSDIRLLERSGCKRWQPKEFIPKDVPPVAAKPLIAPKRTPNKLYWNIGILVVCVVIAMYIFMVALPSQNAANNVTNVTVLETPPVPKTVASVATIKVPAHPVINFISNLPDPNQPQTVDFIDLSATGVTQWNWSFGNGYYSNEQNPEITFDTPGEYSITLLAANETGVNQTTKTILVTANPVVTEEVTPVPETTEPPTPQITETPIPTPTPTPTPTQPVTIITMPPSATPTPYIPPTPNNNQ